MGFEKQIWAERGPWAGLGTHIISDPIGLQVESMQYFISTTHQKQTIISAIGGIHHWEGPA